MKWLGRVLAVLAGAGIAAGCGGDGGDSCDPISATLVDRIEVTPASPTLTPGATLQLNATAFSCSGALSGITFTWASTQSSIVSVTSTGVVQGMAIGGPVRVTASAQTKTGGADVTVGLVPVASVDVVPPTATIGLSRTAQLTALALDADGNELPDRAVTWSSSDEAIATVSTTGVVTGVAIGGPVTITATIEGKSDAAQVTVVLVPVSTVTVAPAQETIGAGATLQLVATARDDQGNVLPGRAFAWTSSNENIAEVSPTGLVTGRQAGGPVTITATSEGRSGTSRITVTVGAPARLVYITQPSDVGAGASIAPAIVVEAQDAGGNRVTSFGSNITLTLVSNPGGATLNGTLTRTAVDGRATFNNISLNRPGNGYTILAGGGGLSVTSAPFNVTAGSVSRLEFVTQPSNTTAGAAISPAVQVELLDALGNRVTGSNAPVTISIGNNPGGATLGGTVTVNAQSGLATFADLTLNRPGSGYTLSAGASGAPAVASSAFNVATGAPSAISFVTMPPASVAAGQQFVASLEVTDGSGNRVTGFSGNVTVTLANGTPGAVLSGTTTVGFSDGVATFSDLAVNLAGTGYVLQANADGLPGVSSTPFDVQAGPASALRFLVQPVNIQEGDEFPNPIEVEIVDANGNRVTSASSQVTIALRNATGGGLGGTGASLSGDPTRNAVAGLAQFPDLTVNYSGLFSVTVRLRARFNDVPDLLSNTFVVTAD